MNLLNHLYKLIDRKINISRQALKALEDVKMYIVVDKIKEMLRPKDYTIWT